VERFIVALFVSLLATAALADGLIGVPLPSSAVYLKSFAKGDAREFTNGCSVGASSAIATCSNAAFAISDVGKNILIRGCGASGIPLQTTISAVTSATQATLAATCTLAVTNVSWVYGSDDTAGVAAAIDRATTAKKTLIVEQGGYWLSSQAAAIALADIAIVCDAQSGTTMYRLYTNGCTFLLDNLTFSAFTPTQGISIKGMTFYWPKQDGTQASPLTYGSLFGGPTLTNFNFENNNVINAYDTFTISGGGSTGAGRVSLKGNKIYSIRYDFNIGNGFQDVLAIDSTNYFGPGVYWDVAAPTSTNLTRFNAASGEHIHIDVAASNYALVDGLLLDGYIIQQHRYGVRIVSGTVDVSTMSNLNVDNTPTALSIEGASSVLSTVWNGGEIYATSTVDTTISPPVFNIATTSNVQLAVSSPFVAFALGSVYYDSASGSRSITWTGGAIANFGRTTTTGGTHYGFVTTGNSTSVLSVSNVNFICGPGTGNAAIGVHTTGNYLVNLGGNTFYGCGYPVQLTGSSGKVFMHGNASVNTGGTYSVNNLVSGTAAVVTQGLNYWDKGYSATTNMSSPN
jgi:hypothetical protein